MSSPLRLMSSSSGGSICRKARVGRVQEEDERVCAMVAEEIIRVLSRGEIVNYLRYPLSCTYRSAKSRTTMTIGMNKIRPHKILLDPRSSLSCRAHSGESCFRVLVTILYKGRIDTKCSLEELLFIEIV